MRNTLKSIHSTLPCSCGSNMSRINKAQGLGLLMGGKYWVKCLGNIRFDNYNLTLEKCNITGARADTKSGATGEWNRLIRKMTDA